MVPQSLTSVAPSSLILSASVSQVTMTRQQDSAQGWVFALILVTFYVAVFLFWLWLDRDAIEDSEPRVHAVKAAPASSQASSESAPVDNLKRIEGIGPKIAGLLQHAGITTFAQLAETDINRLNGILRNANLSIANPATWPEQARLAAEGEWPELEKLQDELKGGIRIE